MGTSLLLLIFFLTRFLGLSLICLLLEIPSLSPHLQGFAGQRLTLYSRFGTIRGWKCRNQNALNCVPLAGVVNHKDGEVIPEVVVPPSGASRVHEQPCPELPTGLADVIRHVIAVKDVDTGRSEEHTSELQSLR